MFMLNLLFNPAATNGRFNAAPPKSGPALPALSQSKTWLSLPDPPNFSTFEPENPNNNWVVVGRDTSLLVSKSAGTANIAVRLAIDPSVQMPSPAPGIRWGTLFGRSSQPQQEQSSPFVFPGTTMPSPLFYEPYLPSGSNPYLPLPSYNGCRGWFFLMSAVAIGPTEPNTTYNFQFIVTALVSLVSVPGGVASYSHDPEMDVQP
jgi:hypothetical protein